LLVDSDDDEEEEEKKELGGFYCGLSPAFVELLL